MIAQNRVEVVSYHMMSLKARNLKIRFQCVVAVLMYGCADSPIVACMSFLRWKVVHRCYLKTQPLYCSHMEPAIERESAYFSGPTPILVEYGELSTVEKLFVRHSSGR